MLVVSWWESGGGWVVEAGEAQTLPGYASEDKTKTVGQPIGGGGKVVIIIIIIRNKNRRRIIRNTKPSKMESLEI